MERQRLKRKFKNIQISENTSIKETNINTVVSRLNRINDIQKIALNQIDILKSMTPMDFLEFRDLLNPASGFQSAQFRIIENSLGLKKENRLKFSKQSYKDFLSKPLEIITFVTSLTFYL